MLRLSKALRLVARFSQSKVPANVDQQAILDDELELRQKLLFKQHSSLQASLDNQLGFFYKMYGTKDSYEPQTSYMANRLMGYYGVEHEVICDHLMKIFRGTLFSTATKDNKFFEEYVEVGLANRIKADIQSMENKGFTLKIFEDKSLLGTGFKEGVSLIEMAMIRGLFTDRTKNRPLTDYHVHKDNEEIGLTIYTPKYLTQPDEFIDPKRNKVIYEQHSNLVVFRVLARIRSSLKLRFKQISIKQELYTWQHLCLFQNLMSPPKIFKSGYRLETYLQWLSKFKFGLWKLADIDNCMRGNSLIKEGLQKDFQDQVFKKSKYDTSETIDIKSGER